MQYDAIGLLSMIKNLFLDLVQQTYFNFNPHTYNQTSQQVRSWVIVQNTIFILYKGSLRFNDTTVRSSLLKTNAFLVASVV